MDAVDRLLIFSPPEVTPKSKRGGRLSVVFDMVKKKILVKFGIIMP